MNISLSLRQLFSLLFLAFIGLLAATALQAWTGPTATAPNGNVAAPINVGTVDQVKSAGISVDALAVFGSQYIQDKLGIGRVSPVVALDVNGTLRLADGGEVCQAVTEGTLRYNAASQAMEFCNGTSWARLTATFLVDGSSQTFSSAGTYSFTVPTYNTLTVTVNGAGGGGGGGYNSAGSSGAASSIASLGITAGGGGGGGGYTCSNEGDGSGVCFGSPGQDGSPGSASGGQTNITGGGSAGGTGGIYIDYEYSGGDGGSGGQAVRTYTAGVSGAPTVGSLLSLTIGAGGAAGGWGGGIRQPTAGTAGSVRFEWQ